MEKLDLSKVYRLIEPGPVVLLTTAKKDKFNIMTMSYLMMVDDGPNPLIAFMIGPWDYSYNTLLETRECAIAIPTADMAEQVMEIGNCSAFDKLDKFKTFSLTPISGKKIKAPLIKECYANFECKIEDTTLLDKYGLIIVKVIEVWLDKEHKEKRMLHHNGDGTLTLDGELINLKEKMTRWPDYT